MAGKLRLFAGVLGLAGLSGGLVGLAGSWTHDPLSPATVFEARPVPDRSPRGRARSPEDPRGDERGDGLDPASDGPSEDEDFAFTVPSGAPSSLPCDDARRIVRQVRATLAYGPLPLLTPSFATATSDWLDPHGLWSAAPDSPIPGAVERNAGPLLAELEAPPSGPCAASRAVGEALVDWTTGLASRFDLARAKAARTPKAPALAALGTAADEALFADESRPARDVAATLGEHLGTLERALGGSITPAAEAARARFFPEFDAEGWAGVVRAAAVRAYVQLTDPHGAWAPRDEEAGVYDVDLDARPPDRLWDDGARTALGIRVDSGPLSPLEVGDVVLSIAGVLTVGLPPEQLDQLVYATTDAEEPAALVVLRRGEREVRELVLPAPEAPEPGTRASEVLPSYRVPYGNGDALVVEIHDVRSDLGDELSATLRAQRRGGGRGIEGLLLDLRDDGGGSTEGVIAAIGLFLPGAPLFPMQRRDGSIEVDRAPEPPVESRWTGAVATLVDEDTASAAEMLAGALDAYRRGLVVGRPTYGKGCAQEYLDDDAAMGVLRLTTLLYALPDGSPVQGVGLEPSLLLPKPRPPARTPEPRKEREADVPNVAPTWRGPDVRDPTLVLPAAVALWADPHGKVGPCRDDEVCRALRALGEATPAKLARRPPTAAPFPPTAAGRRP